MYTKHTRNSLITHYEKYPEMQIQDAVKLLFQSEFGPGHLLSNTDYARKYLLTGKYSHPKDMERFIYLESPGITSGAVMDSSCPRKS